MDNTEPVTDDEAEKKLAQFFGTSFRDFMTTTYLHQEAIRDILTQEPRQRNDAIDRLLGLTDYNNLLTGIKESQLSQKQRSLAEALSGFENSVATILTTRQRAVDEARQQAQGAGLNTGQMTAKGAIAAAADAKGALDNFVRELGGALNPLEVPDNWNGLSDFAGSVKRRLFGCVLNCRVLKNKPAFNRERQQSRTYKTHMSGHLHRLVWRKNLLPP